MVQPNLVPFSTEDYYDVLSRREVVSLGGSVGCRAQLLIDSDLEAEFERAKHDEGAEVGGHGFRLLKEHAGRKGGYENPTRAYYAALAWMRAWRARRRGAEASCAVRAFMADTIAEMARQSMSPGSSRAASPERRGGGRGGDGGLVRGSLGVALSDARHTPRPWHPSSGEVLPGSRAEAAPAGPLDNNLGDFGDGNGGARFSVRRQLDGYFSAMRALTPPPAQRPPRGTHESLSFGPMSSGGGAPPVDGAVARELAGWYADTLCSLDGVLGQLRAHAAVVEASMRTGN
ncbi:hypothetical protein FOA52_006145 [Chlamydomonas sp. UWO 241]|nr:hypothetical protein FOA52_006145 [Chlamydomonas sp. UWO 241]